MGEKIKTPVLLTIAGSDCSGGAGIQADLKTFRSLGGYGASVVTAVVWENPSRMGGMRILRSGEVGKQMEMVSEAFPVAAMKTGVLGSAANVREVAARLSRLRGAGRGLKGRPPLVIDPVMAATSGGKFSGAATVRAMCEDLFPLATLITPNADEAGVLLGKKVEDGGEAARRLWERYGVAVLVKGGHLKGMRAVDFLCDGEGEYRFDGKRVRGADRHGSGCTYSAAICAYLGKGLPLCEAIAKGKRYISHAIAHPVRAGKWRLLG